MSEARARAGFALAEGIAYLAGGYPVTAGIFFTGIFGSNAQREYDRLKARYGMAATVGFFAQFDTFFDDAFAGVAGTLDGMNLEPDPDPAVNLPGFVAALRTAGTTPGGAFDTLRLLDVVVTPALAKRAAEVVDRRYGAASARGFADLFGAIVLSASHASGEF